MKIVDFITFRFLLKFSEISGNIKFQKIYNPIGVWRRDRHADTIANTSCIIAARCKNYSTNTCQNALIAELCSRVLHHFAISTIQTRTVMCRTNRWCDWQVKSSPLNWSFLCPSWCCPACLVLSLLLIASGVFPAWRWTLNINVTL